MSGEKTRLVPKLRFPEFRDAEGWLPVTLQEASTPVTERVGERKLTPVSISAGIGFVPQADKFGRDISGNQYQLYTVVSDGDFVYNKGNSLKFPQGCVYQLRGWGQVAAPNVFISFRLKEAYSDVFFQNCFEQNMHGKQLKKHITSGARSNGLLNISKEHFFGVEIPTPSPAEQQKIADCLSSLDELIAAQGRKVEALKTHKKGLMQQLFPREGETQPRLRFPEFQDAGDWEIKPFAKLFSIGNGRDHKHLAPGAIPVYGSGGFMRSVDEYLYDGESVCIGRKGTINNPMFLTGRFWTVDTLFYTHSFNKCLPKFIFSIFQNINWLKHNEAGGVPSLSKTNIEKIVSAIPSVREQQRIADCLSSLEDHISAEAQKLEALKARKKGLMQQLFPSPGEVDA